MFRWPRLRIKKTRQRPPAKAYTTHKEAARALITERLQHHAATHGFIFKRVAIRDTRRSWGSCSAKANLNFSYKLLFLPACLREYIIIHELCHLRELNHSHRFWAEVVAIMPDARERARALRILERTYGTSVGALQKLQATHTCPHCIHLEHDRTTVLMPPEGEGSDCAVR